MARKKQRPRRFARVKDIRRPEEVTVSFPGLIPLKQKKLTRAEIFQRNHKDMSTNELNCRIQGLASQASDNAQKIEDLSSELVDRRKDQKELTSNIEVLEQLVESRR